MLRQSDSRRICKVQTFPATIATTLAVVFLSTACSNSSDNNSAQQTPQPQQPELIVTDSDAVGVNGDDLLSLVEAIQLANGELLVSQLSAAEQTLVTGTPGSNSSDTIRVALRDSDRIEMPVQTVPDGPEWFPLTVSSSLPPLLGNDGDTLDGAGFILSNGAADGPLGGLALDIRSSNFTLENFTFERFAQMLSIAPLDDAGLEGVVVRNNAFLNGGGITVVATAADGTRATLRNMVIENNELLGPPEFGGLFPRKIHTGISLLGAPLTSPAGNGAAIVEDVTLANNTIRGFYGGIQLTALQSYFDNSDSMLRAIRVAGNIIEMPTDAGDPAVYVWGSVTLGGMAMNARIEDLEITGNTISGSGYVVLVTAVEHVSGQNLRTEQVELQDVRITDNIIRPVNTCEIGLLVMTAFVELSSGAAVNNAIDGLEIAGNDIADCATGVFITPLLNWGTAGTSMGNRMTNVQVRDNTVRNATTGVLASGGTILANSLGYEDSSDAVVDANVLRGLQLSGNTVSAIGEGIALFGGMAIDAPGIVRNNELMEALVEENDLSGTATGCIALADAAIRSGAAVAGNTIDADISSCGP